jgi:hypothetical protein
LIDEGIVIFIGTFVGIDISGGISLIVVVGGGGGGGGGSGGDGGGCCCCVHPLRLFDSSTFCSVCEIYRPKSVKINESIFVYKYTFKTH